jgi:hypothetical protein
LAKVGIGIALLILIQQTPERRRSARSKEAAATTHANIDAIIGSTKGLNNTGHVLLLWLDT